MTPSSPQVRTPKTEFGEEYAAALSAWGAVLAAGSGPIVAISRKAPRLLELGVREGLIPDAILHRVTSERGMGLMQLSTLTEPLKICDDIVIVGSTFCRISSVARELCGAERVVGLPFAVSSTAVAENMKIVRDSAPVTLANDICSSFVLSEVAAFGFLDKPYDIEHPIVAIDLDAHVEPHDVEDALEAFADANSLNLYATPRHLTDAKGHREQHFAWTLLFGATSSGARSGHIRKIRCYMDQTQSRLLLVPIQTGVGTLSEFQTQADGLPDLLLQCWQEIPRTSPQQDSDLAQTSRKRSIIAWASFLLELEGLHSVLGRLRVALLDRDLVSRRGGFYFDAYDLQLLTGVGSVESIKARLESFVNSTKFGQPRATVARKLRSLHPVIPEIYTQTYQAVLTDMLEGAACVAEVLKAIFKAQHLEVELKTRESEPQNPRRLEFGVPFSYLADEVEKALGSGDERELHEALDALIDSGIIVPRYLSQEIDGEEVWFRSFRAGEALANVRSHVARECFKALSGVFGKSELRELLTEKFLVLVCDVDGLFQSPSLASSPEIQRAFHLYGARPQVVAGGRAEWFVDWAQRRRVLRKSGHHEDPLYSLDPRSNDYFRDDENPLSHPMRHEVAALARWTKAAHDADGLGNDFLIAITTVESTWAYRRALEAEITGWTHHVTWGIAPALHALDDCQTNGNTATKQRAKTALENLANWIAQARVKHQLRTEVSGLLERADKKWSVDSYEENASTWRNIVRPKLENRRARACSPPNVIEETLVPTLNVLGRLTSLLRNIFSQFCAMPDERAIPVNESASELTAALNALPSQLRDSFAGAIEVVEKVGASTNLTAALPPLHKAVGLIADAADWVLMLHPDMTDEPLDPLRPGLFVLLWDVRGSTTNETRAELTRKVMEVNRSVGNSFKRRLVQFDMDSTDDGNAAVCQDFDTAMAVAEVVAAGYAPFTVKMGCDTNADGMLCRSRVSRRLSGRAYEYAARMMSFYSEIKAIPTSWLGEKGENTGLVTIPAEPEKKSYLLISEPAYRAAEEQPKSEELLRPLAPLTGWYRPRVHGAYKRRVWIRKFDPHATAIQLNLIE